MSRSNAAAINRRVNVPVAQSGNNLKPSFTTPSTPSINQTQQQSGLTLPQVISVFDNRLILLEKFMNETKLNPITNNGSNEPNNQTTNNQTNIQEKPNFNAMEHVSINDFNTIINEFNNRFELFAHEISDLKEIILKLQSYTMDVNKILLEEKNILNSYVVTNNNLANTNEETSNTNNNSDESNDMSNDKSTDNSSIDLKNLTKQEFLQTN
uniref:Uncharacterized protein n=1 Tax=viral metagenome TaxID=1070528 RepID=A0A6C0DBY0_9ZZZZ